MQVLEDSSGSILQPFANDEKLRSRTLDDGTSLTSVTRTRYVGVFTEQGELAGTFILRYETAICAEIHFAFLPKYWGKPIVREGFEAVMRHIKNRTPYQTIYGFVPEYNEEAIKLCTENRFKKRGVLPMAWQKGGNKYDMIYLTREL